MIEYITIDNYKSISALGIRLDKFNCFIGMNGAGKSTILQVFDFISHVMIGDVDEWLKKRSWEASDIKSKTNKLPFRSFEMGFKLKNGKILNWIILSSLHKKNSFAERIAIEGENYLRSSEKMGYSIEGKSPKEIAFNYQGSILSVLKDSELPPELIEFRDAMRNMRSLELLSPQLLRKRARSTEDDIGQGGEKLSAFLGTIKGEKKSALLKVLQKFYPTVTDFRVSNLRSGWKKLIVIEEFEGKKLETEATHLNDGLLRILAILAILAQASTNHSVILLDEIENGINQEIIEILVDTLVESPQQFIVTTHSPLILNYLSDEVAKKAVQLVYKTPQGETRVRRFFDIPRIEKKLAIMGPGDAFVDTDLKALTQECIALDNEIMRKENEATH